MIGDMRALSQGEFEIRRSHRARRDERRLARALARQRAAAAIAGLLREAPPTWFDDDQHQAYLLELRRLLSRAAPPAHASERGPA